jgi:glycosyltransferase EpsF
MLKVLHLVHSLNRGGIEIWLMSMLQEISRQECSMDICCKGFDTGKMAGMAEELGAKVWLCPLGPTHVRFIQQLKQLFVQGQYDIIHNHLENYSGFPVWLANQLDIPVITSFHNTNIFAPQTSVTRLPLLRQLRSLYTHISIPYALQHSSLITGCSQAVLQSLKQFNSPIEVRSEVLYYGVDISPSLTVESRAAFRQALGWSADTPLVLHVGRLIEQKNHEGLLTVFQAVVEQIPSAKLLLVGEGPLQSQIERSIADRQLTSSVRLLGLRDDVTKIMGCCDVFLFPSHYEGLGVVLLEAGATRLPIVASRVPGSIEAVQDGKTARLHDVADSAGMAQSVVQILSDRPYAQQLAEAGQAWITQHFSTAVSARRLFQLYHRLTSTTHQPELQTQSPYSRISA